MTFQGQAGLAAGGMHLASNVLLSHGVLGNYEWPGCVMESLHCNVSQGKLFDDPTRIIIAQIILRNEAILSWRM